MKHKLDGPRVKTINFRVEPKHEAKLAELAKATGMTQSQVMRSLLENAKLEPRPVPVATLLVGNQEAAQ